MITFLAVFIFTFSLIIIKEYLAYSMRAIQSGKKRVKIHVYNRQFGMTGLIIKRKRVKLGLRPDIGNAEALTITSLSKKIAKQVYMVFTGTLKGDFTKDYGITLFYRFRPVLTFIQDEITVPKREEYYDKYIGKWGFLFL